MRRRICILLTCVLLLGSSTAVGADAAWRTLCADAPTLVEEVRSELLSGKDFKRASLVLTGHRYRARMDSSKSYGQTLSRFYFNRVLRVKTIAETFQIVRDIRKSAAEFHAKNAPLLAQAQEIETLARTVRDALAKNPATAATLKDVTFTGTGVDELSVSLKKLSEALAADKTVEASAWAAEVHGTAMRLHDLLRWVDLQTEWLIDLASVLDGFSFCIETSDRAVAAAGGWKNFMFGRLPGASSILELSIGDALMAELLLCGFFTVSDADAPVMGKPGARCPEVIPACRAAFVKVCDALPKNARVIFEAIPTTDYELTALNANLWRYNREKQLDGLIGSLKRYAKRRTKPSVTEMMEVIHIAQGAFGSTTSAGDRYHVEMVAWSKKLKGKPEKAVAQAHALAYGFYTQDGRTRYRGRLWSIHDAHKAGATDCIRASQMMGSAYANAGYTGLHPVRVCRGSVGQKLAGTSGHTLVCAHLGKRNVCLDPLVKRSFLRSFDKTHARDRGVLSVAKGYRTLDSFVTGEMHFPQGPKKFAQLRVPYYNMERKGFPKHAPVK